MAATMPSGDAGPSTTKASQLITPSLTPVSEEFPWAEDTSPFYDATSQPLNGGPVYGEAGQDGSHDARDPTTPPARQRSFSVPGTMLNQPLQTAGDHVSARRLTTASSNPTKQSARREVLKLSSTKIKELTSAPGSLPVRPAPYPFQNTSNNQNDMEPNYSSQRSSSYQTTSGNESANGRYPSTSKSVNEWLTRKLSEPIPLLGQSSNAFTDNEKDRRPQYEPSAPGEQSRQPSGPKEPSHQQPPFESPPSPMPELLPLPPLSMPTYLHLELSAERPSPLYVYQPSTSSAQYESTSVKFERLLNFLLLPPQLERALFFGALACLDAWLYTFTILPLRFLKALWMLVEWAAVNVSSEVRYLTSFVWAGTGRLWYRRRESVRIDPDTTESSRGRSSETGNGNSKRPNSVTLEDPKSLRNRFRKESSSQPNSTDQYRSRQQQAKNKHRRTRSIPSLLQPNHKADLLQGTLIIVSCMVLLRFDASRMYHSIRGQAAIKLYVIYNVLEVCDRLFSALGQDIIECLFSPETLTRYPNGRSKVIRPLWMFILALVYTVSHATAFFYQVITLNVAINGYSNALLTLLMSNQFVEIKGTVFKKFEKENLFQLTCADVVERFQLWLVLLIIALRNIVEMGGLSVTNSGQGPGGFPSSDGGLGDGLNANSNAATNATASSMPFHLPTAFTILPSIFPAQVLVPFLVVLASEMLVDWLKHAYIAKFNAVSPNIYSRYYDVLAKDYYSTAFHPQQERGMVRRLGLPVIPLSCLFIRALLQTYHMFIAKNISSSTLSKATGLSELGASKASGFFDHFFLRALGRSTFGGGTEAPATMTTWWLHWTLDDAIALATMLVFFLVLYLLLLGFKLVLGMVLLRVARNRYRRMKEREFRHHTERERGRSLTQDRTVDYSVPGKRVGPWGVVEMGDERRRIIYEGDAEGLKSLKEREARAKDKERKKQEALTKGQSDGLDSVDRYRMVAKRIW